jgi:hypothetical protein
MTHWQLADGSDVEIISWLDDHSRFLLHISVHPNVTVKVVTDTLLATGHTHVLPASTLPDNGKIYTTRFARGNGGPNRFEYLIDSLGIVQKNGSPGHPQTQGKIERFHQTLKKWLTARPDARNLKDLQVLLEAFQQVYNHERPHRAVGRRTPAGACEAPPKAHPHRPARQVLAGAPRHRRHRLRHNPARTRSLTRECSFLDAFVDLCVSETALRSGWRDRPCPSQRAQQEWAVPPGIYQEEQPFVTSG